MYVSNPYNTLSSESNKYSVSPCIPLKWIFDVFFFFLYHHSSLSAVSWEWGEVKSRYNSCCSPGYTSQYLFIFFLWACSFAFPVIRKWSQEDWDQTCRGFIIKPCPRLIRPRVGDLTPVLMGFTCLSEEFSPGVGIVCESMCNLNGNLTSGRCWGTFLF